MESELRKVRALTAKKFAMPKPGRHPPVGALPDKPKARWRVSVNPAAGEDQRVAVQRHRGYETVAVAVECIASLGVAARRSRATAETMRDQGFRMASSSLRTENLGLSAQTEGSGSLASILRIEQGTDDDPAVAAAADASSRAAAGWSNEAWTAGTHEVDTMLAKEAALAVAIGASPVDLMGGDFRDWFLRLDKLQPASARAATERATVA